MAESSSPNATNCSSCGHGNRLDGEIVHASDCPERDPSATWGRMATAVAKLHALCADQHPGLSTWHEMLDKAKTECVNSILAFEPLKSSPDAIPPITVGEDEIKRFRVGDILFSDEQAKMFCDLAVLGLRSMFAPSATSSVSPALAYQQAIRESVGSILSQYAADLILKRAEKIHEANNG